MPSIRELFDLSGKVAVVTGGRNLGHDAAEALLELGASVAVTSRDPGRAEQYAARLAEGTGGKVMGLSLEATNEESWKELVAKVSRLLGDMDILVNNAGGRNPEVRTARSGTSPADLAMEFLDERPLELWRATLDADLTSAFLGCRAVSPLMRARGSGKIINIASIDGIVGRDLRVYQGTGLSPTVPDYLAAKAGVIGLTRGVAVALAPFGINVNSISPGGFFRGQPEAFVRSYESHVPLGRMGKAGEDLKGAVAYLSSRASNYVTGHNLVVDGGWSIW